MDHDGELARVIVRDQGSGASPGDTEAIFQQYIQPGPRRGGVADQVIRGELTVDDLR